VKRLAALAGILLPWMTGCFDDPVAGGTVETENTVAARTFSVDSLLSPWNRPSNASTVATLRLDGSNLPFEKTSASGLDLAIERLDSQAIPFRTVDWDKVSRRGRIEVLLTPSMQHKDSRFRLRWGLKDSLRADSAAVWSSIPEAQRFLLTSVLVDDFEDSTLQSPLPNKGWWYSSATDSATISSPQLAPSQRTGGGKALRVTYKVPDSKLQYALVGLVLTSGPRSLRSMDSLVFWARGPGKLSVAFDRFGPNVSQKAWTTLELDSNWRRIRIRPSDLDPAAGASDKTNVGWEGVRDSVANLTFFARGGTTLWLDELRLHGVNRDDLK
jgi:hypothetical protein